MLKLENFETYLNDESNMVKGTADEIYFPTSEKEICDLLKKLSIKKCPVTISGARTGIVGGAVPNGGFILSTDKMNKILAIEKKEDEFFLWTEPGVKLSDLQLMIETKNLPLEPGKLKEFKNDPLHYFYPPDPTEDSASIGGTVATNASGARSLYYGPTRNYIKQLRIALSNGTILDIERGKNFSSDEGKITIIDTKGGMIKCRIPSYQTPDIKCSSGYFIKKNMDLIDLFIGSEGTLGVICALKIALKIKPEFILSGLSFFTSQSDAISFVQACRNLDSHSPLSLEYFDKKCLLLIESARESNQIVKNIPLIPKSANSAIFWEFPYKKNKIESLFEIIETLLIHNNSSMDDTWSGLDKNEKATLKQFRHLIPELINLKITTLKKNCPSITKIGTDFAVPNECLNKLIKIYNNVLSKCNLEYVIFGHIGENNLHLNFLPKSQDELSVAKNIVILLATEVMALNGTIAAEHGIGKLKHYLLKIQYNKNKIQEMARLKSSIDPSSILGRGNIFPESYLNI